MARRLIIMRHAKSDWDAQAHSDFDRPLAKRGWRDAPRMGQWLLSERMQPDFVVSSPAKRARQTVIEVCTALKINPDTIQWQPKIYEAGVGELLRVLAVVPPASQCTLLVGHNPGLEMLLTHLVSAENIHRYAVANSHSGGLSDTGNEEYPPEFGIIKTATVVYLELPDIWTELPRDCAQLLGKKNPRELAKG
ncbi:MAG: histidine phosphatase family protein [Magnetococcus sp. DMHC-1]|nr:histidine phosphatase family protein [Magnetococcales bacterium]